MDPGRDEALAVLLDLAAMDAADEVDADRARSLEAFPTFQVNA